MLRGGGQLYIKAVKTPCWKEFEVIFFIDKLYGVIWSVLFSLYLVFYALLGKTSAYYGSNLCVIAADKCLLRRILAWIQSFSSVTMSDHYYCPLVVQRFTLSAWFNQTVVSFPVLTSNFPLNTFVTSAVRIACNRTTVFHLLFCSIVDLQRYFPDSTDVLSLPKFPQTAGRCRLSKYFIIPCRN